MSVFEAHPIVSGLLLFGFAYLSSRLSTPRAAPRAFVDQERDARCLRTAMKGPDR